MQRHLIRSALSLILSLLTILPSIADERPPAAHGISMHGTAALTKSFAHLPYANPTAPKGGVIAYGEMGGFDSLNPYIVKGRFAWGVRAHVYETLMARNWDESFSLYGLIAESIRTPDDRTWVEFKIRTEAKFSDNTPITAHDVLFSMETLRDHGKPYYAGFMSKITKAEVIDDHLIRFDFEGSDRELPLLLGLIPVLPKHYWSDKEFSETTLDRVIGSGPYTVGDFEQGRTIRFERNKNYWGKDLPINQGLNNADTISYRYYRDNNARITAFKAGEFNQLNERDPARWEDTYNDLIEAGTVQKEALKQQRPTGMQGLVFNTRKEIFEDIRVREALTLAFDFEWMNRTLFQGAYGRIESYFHNSPLGFKGPLEGAEADLLAPFMDQLPTSAITGKLRQPKSDGKGRNRKNLRAATKLLKEAGWNITDGRLTHTNGQAFTFDIILGSSTFEKVVNAYKQSLEKLGITVNVITVDSAQFTQRRQEYDYDMMINRWWLSLSPGNEQTFYWGSDGRETIGTRNYMGMNDPAADAMIKALLAAKTAEDFKVAVNALDRVLTNGRYVIPFWFLPTDRIVWHSNLNKPEKTSLYGYQPPVWWVEE